MTYAITDLRVIILAGKSLMYLCSWQPFDLFLCMLGFFYGDSLRVKKIEFAVSKLGRRAMPAAAAA